MVQVVVPMAGFGERFRSVGYRIPKPLIRVDGRQMVAHAIAPFPSSAKVFFVCNEDHLADPELGMASTLRRLRPEATIVGIPPHHLGPSHSVAQVLGHLDPSTPTVVNYCDFSSSLDYQALSQAVSEHGSEGIIPCYRGFHPHSLRSTNYAYVKARDGQVEEIREKQPFTSQPTSEYASSGTYFFATASLLTASLDYQFKNDLSVKGEYFVSLAYRYLLEQNLPVRVFPLEHFSQWGTPQDLADYRVWSQGFISLSQSDTMPNHVRGTLLLTMAGEGSRFASQGYKTPKPLLKISGAPMFRHAIETLPATEKTLLITQVEQIDTGRTTFEGAIPPGAKVLELKSTPPGQAASAALGLDQLESETPDLPGPLIISAADGAYSYNREKLLSTLASDNTDVVVWGFRGHPGAKRRPTDYSWISHNLGFIERVMVKEPPENPDEGLIVTSAFAFKHPGMFRDAFHRLQATGVDSSEELSMDNLINHAIDLGLRCVVFEVDHFYCWGTPEELQIFDYWKTYFDSDERHPYRSDTDSLAQCVSKTREHVD